MIDSRSKAGCIVQEDVGHKLDRVSSKKWFLKGGFTPSPNSFVASRTFVSGARSEVSSFEC